MNRLVTVAVVVLFGAMALSASPIATIDFGVIAPTTGSISFAGGNAPLIGLDIEVDNVTGLDTPVNNGVQQACVGCVLNFTTGNLISFVAGTYTFAGGGSISITGAIPGIPGVVDPLMIGTLTGLQLVVPAGGSSKVSILAYGDTKDPALAAYFGLPNVNWSGGANISFNATADPTTHAFTSNPVLSGDVFNQVPEPSTMLLLGGALIALAGVGRRWAGRR